MCASCGGTCGRKRRRVRFVDHPAPANLEVKGTAGGVDHILDALITQSGGMLTYESLYTTLGPDNQPAYATIPGTFGAHATRAIPARRY